MATLVPRSTATASCVLLHPAGAVVEVCSRLDLVPLDGHKWGALDRGGRRQSRAIHLDQPIGLPVRWMDDLLSLLLLLPEERYVLPDTLLTGSFVDHG